MKKKIISQLFAKPNVVTIGQGYKHVGGKPTQEMCLIVGVERKVRGLSPKDLVPKEVDGLLTDVVEVGHLHLVEGVVGGAGIGPLLGGTGTITCWVRDGEGRELILSNYHVLGSEGRVFHPNKHGEEVGVVWNHVPLRPILERRPKGYWDWGLFRKLSYQVWYVVRYIYRKATGNSKPTNKCDAAVALPTFGAPASAEIRGVGPLLGLGQATVGSEVVRSGVVSGVQRGNVIAVNTNVTLSFPEGRVSFNNAILLGGRPADYGDSGSIVVDADGLAVGMVFAAGLLTICLPMRDALQALGVALVTKTTT